MELAKLLEGFKHKQFSININKVNYEVNKLSMSVENVEWYNNVINSMKDLGFKKGETTDSGSVSVHDIGNFYYIINKNHSIELIIKWIKGGIYRFVLGTQSKSKDNPISGTKALKILLNKAEEYGVLDVFESNRVSKDEGIELNNNNQRPIIGCLEVFKGGVYHNVHHIDLNSSYASRISEKYPQLRPMYEDLYKLRKNDNNLYKHVLTNSIGAMHSKYCVDKDGRRQPFAYAKFAQIAINGTNDKIKELTDTIINSDGLPLLYNTDGIWYQGPIIDGSSNEFGGWKIDHKNCDLYIKSSGAYQYKEDGKVVSIVRGPTTLDAIKPREKWNWLEIKNYPVIQYKLEGDYLCLN